MLWLTQDAVVVCKHENGRVQIAATQDFVSVGGRKVLVEKDPEGRPIAGCPNVGAAIKPCLTTLAVTDGYSGFLTIEGRRICLDTVYGPD
jgi:hypothetical protein